MREANLKNQDKYILGDGVFEIGDIAVAVTRGGGVFEIAKEYRAIEHDGARGEYVKKMINLDRATPKLLINALSILDGVDFSKMYANIKAEKTGNSTKITGTFEIKESDFQVVHWRGFLNTGEAVKITVKNAINLENFNWAMADKSEIVHALNFIGCYDLGSKVQPWEIIFGTATPGVEPEIITTK